jgi:MoxR-like ATPase
VKSSSRARDGLYTFDALGRLRDAQMAGANLAQSDNIQKRLDNPKKSYFKLGALGKAIAPEDEKAKGKRAVVLIDEVDKADADFANDLLLELDEFKFDVPELDAPDNQLAIQGDKPIVILTSNRERPLPDAFLRRCLYFNIGFPSITELIDIANRRTANLLGGQPDLLKKAIDVFITMQEMMNKPGSKPPGTSEFLSLLAALQPKEDISGILDNLHEHVPLLGILLKTETDQKKYVDYAKKEAANLKKAQEEAGK